MLCLFLTNPVFYTITRKKYKLLFLKMLVILCKDRSKLVQHFIQHHVFAMLDEMLEWFAQLQNL